MSFDALPAVTSQVPDARGVSGLHTISIGGAAPSADPPSVEASVSLVPASPSLATPPCVAPHPVTAAKERTKNDATVLVIRIVGENRSFDFPAVHGRLRQRASTSRFEMENSGPNPDP